MKSEMELLEKDNKKMVNQFKSIKDSDKCLQKEEIVKVTLEKDQLKSCFASEFQKSSEANSHELKKLQDEFSKYKLKMVQNTN